MESLCAIHVGVLYPALKRASRLLHGLSAFLVAVSLSAAQPAAFNDGIDRTDPNFVTASLLVMFPGVLLEGGAIWR